MEEMMIEKIGIDAYKHISTVAEEVILCIDKLKNRKNPITVCEIGIGIGTTSIEILKHLTYGDTFILFDFDDIVKEFMDDIYNNKLVKEGVNVIGYGNEHKIFCSYSWELAKITLQRKVEKKTPEIFDLAYLDGSHIFIHDSCACILLKLMIKNGGFLIFDDVKWTLQHSATNKPKVRPQTLLEYTQEQISTPHIDMILKLFMDEDRSYVRLNVESGTDRAVFKKKMRIGERLTSWTKA
jgi:predicted O-methyltransferase YrrM